MLRRAWLPVNIAPSGGELSSGKQSHGANVLDQVHFPEASPITLGTKGFGTRDSDSDDEARQLGSAAPSLETSE